MRTVVGTMTGTSMDAVDAVAVSIHGHGLEMTADFKTIASVELGELAIKLRHLASGNGSTVEMSDAATELGHVTVDAISRLGLDSIDIIALHGQTIYHKPPTSIQLIDPAPVFDTYPCTIMTDPRKADLKHGGQGAPITPLADWVMFRSIEASTAIVNLGGFCNVTLIPAASDPKEIRGFDVCCCNLLINTIARQMLNKQFDQNGREALRGKLDLAIYDQLLERLEQQRTSNRSLGTGDDIGEFAVSIGSNCSPSDLLATATNATGTCITNSIQGIDRVFLAGGGVHNAALVKAIQNNGTTGQLNVPTQAREGMAMAILGALSQDGISITLPNITGRKKTSTPVGWVHVRP